MIMLFMRLIEKDTFEILSWRHFGFSYFAVYISHVFGLLWHIGQNNYITYGLYIVYTFYYFLHRLLTK